MHSARAALERCFIAGNLLGMAKLPDLKSPKLRPSQRRQLYGYDFQQRCKHLVRGGNLDDAQCRIGSIARPDDSNFAAEPHEVTGKRAVDVGGCALRRKDQSSK